MREQSDIKRALLRLLRQLQVLGAVIFALGLLGAWLIAFVGLQERWFSLLPGVHMAFGLGFLAAAAMVQKHIRDLE